MVEHRVDGVIICSTSFGARQSRELLANGCPVVVVNNHAAEEYRYSIYHDDLDGSRQVTRHLIGLGHTKIAYISNTLSGRITLDRLSGFKKEMQNARLAIPESRIIAVQGGHPGAGLEAIRHILALPEQPTAIFCFNDMIALGVLQGLAEKGLRAPGDISVAGFDNIIFSEYTNPPLTTLDQPKRFIGMEAARLMVGLVKSPCDPGIPEEACIRRLKGRLLVRQSTAPPSQE
jgi:DNA-binding LacI/PurR family transcriptional regulator